MADVVKRLMELCQNGFQAQLREFKGCGSVKMYIVFPEIFPVDDLVMACASWLEKKGRCDVQKDDIPVAG